MKERSGSGYYVDKLAGARLAHCYDVAPARVRRYLQAEIDFAIEHVRPSDRVLELGTGYGRVLASMVGRAACLVGIDTSEESLAYGASLKSFPKPRSASESLPPCQGGMEGGSPRDAESTVDRTGVYSSIHLLAMDALRLGFADGCFDVTLCLQNGLSAFKIDRQALVREAIRVTRPGGVALFSTYAACFWADRLAWFEAQAAHGLIGAIDYDLTGDGTIVCKDGFRATTISAEEFLELCRNLGDACALRKIDESSLFCVVRKGHSYSNRCSAPCR